MVCHFPFCDSGKLWTIEILTVHSLCYNTYEEDISWSETMIKIFFSSIFVNRTYFPRD